MSSRSSRSAAMLLRILKRSTSMRAVLLAAAAAITLAACATQAPSEHNHAAHATQGGQPAAKVDQQMKMMQDMHQKMMAAKTPEERAALMTEHMKSMQSGMSMMCEMGGGMGTSDASGAADTMKRCMEMKDMTMQMMMDREGAKGPNGK
jgi:hypothetical protein